MNSDESLANGVTRAMDESAAVRVLSSRDFPTVVLIDTVNFCNARCPFCPLFQGESQVDREKRPATIMPQELFDRILRELRGWERPPDSILLSPNSEILTDPLLMERLDTLRSFDMAKVTTLLTNGQFLDEAKARAILEAGVQQLMPGFDGASKTVYEGHRVRCNYERVLGNIQSFVKLRDASAHKTNIIIKFVRTPRNDHEVADAYSLFNAFLDPELDRFNDALATDWANVGSSVDALYYYPKLTEGRRVGRCNYFEDGLMIQADGKIGACCWDYNLTISGGGLGDANDTSLLDVWRGGRRQALQQSFLACDDNIPDACKSCIMIYEWDPIPDRLVRFEDSIIESRGPTSFMCLFRGTAAPATEPLAEASPETGVARRMLRRIAWFLFP